MNVEHLCRITLHAGPPPATVWSIGFGDAAAERLRESEMAMIYSDGISRCNSTKEQ